MAKITRNQGLTIATGRGPAVNSDDDKPVAKKPAAKKAAKATKKRG